MDEDQRLDEPRRKTLEQLATSALSPIVEQQPTYLGNGSARRTSHADLRHSDRSLDATINKPRHRISSSSLEQSSDGGSRSSPLMNGISTAFKGSPSPTSLAASRTLLPPETHAFRTQESSRARTSSRVQEGTAPPDSHPSADDALASSTPVRRIPFTPPPETNEAVLVSDDGGLPADSHASPTPLPPFGPIRPAVGTRSLTSPPYKRLDSTSRARITRRDSSRAREASRSRQQDLTPLKIGHDGHRDPEHGRATSPTRDRAASPMPAVLPLPPLSFPMYLQLELAAEAPPPLYIHRSTASEFPYESSRVKFERLLNFLRLPHQLEQVLWFGTLACLDAWLYTFTILPLRFLKALAVLVAWSLSAFAREATELNRFVSAGMGRLWRRHRHGERPTASRNNSTTSTRSDVDARQPRPRVTSINSSHEMPKARRRISSGSRVRVDRQRRGPSALSIDHKADLLHGLLLIVSCMILVRFDASRMYHSIRGQAAIKLYVIYNVLEVCDRLFSALGQDILECLFSKETLERKPNGRSKVIRPFWMFVLALVYNVIHATLLFYQVVTLNVAVNSYSNALLTLLMSNQFVEIKGTVFKKFEKENLFQLTCADVVERFQLWLMLSIIASRNIVEVGGLSLSSYTWPSPAAPPASSSNTSALPPNSTATPGFGPSGAASLLPVAFSLVPSLNNPVLTPFLIVLGSEMLVDWLKHAYINKFNSVKPAIYGRFLDVLAKDYYGHAFVTSQNLTKRLGLPTLPLACLVLRAAAQVWGMFLATGSGFASSSSSSSEVVDSLTATSSLPAELGRQTATFDALRKMDHAVRRALGRSTLFGGDPAFSPPPISSTWFFQRWSGDDVIACATALVFFTLLYLVLLAAKLLLGMALLRFARDRYKGMKERERRGYDAHARRVGGWGVVEVDDDKRRWIYDGDDEGLRRARERDAREREKRRGAPDEGGGGGDAGKLKLEGVGRYMMAAKRIW